MSGHTLKRCPFCGASPHKGPTKATPCQLHGELIQRFEVWCPKGCARVNGVNKEQAIAAWNERPIERELLEAAEGIMGMLFDGLLNTDGAEITRRTERMNAAILKARGEA